MEIPTSLDWQEIKQLPIYVLHTLRGPMTGRIEVLDDDTLKVWAPAMLNFVSDTNVIYMPTAFVEHFICVSKKSLIGWCPAPAIIATNYDTRFYQQFAEDSFRMHPVIIGAAINAEMSDELNITQKS